jgi:hypothetical protein
MENNNKVEIKGEAQTQIDSNNITEVTFNGKKLDPSSYNTVVKPTNFTFKTDLPELKPTALTLDKSVNGTYLEPVVGPVYTVEFKPFNKSSDVISAANVEVPIRDHLEEYRVVKTIEKTDDALLNAVLSYSVYEEKEWILNYINKPLSDEIKEKLTQCVINSSSNNATTEKNIETLFDLKLLTFCKNFFQPVSSTMLQAYSDNNLILINENQDSAKISNYQLSDIIQADKLSDATKFILDGMNDDEKAQISTYNDNTKKDAGLYMDGFFSSSDDFAHAHVLTSNHPKGGKVLHVSFRGTEFTRGLGYLATKYIPQAYLDMSAYYDKNFKSFEKALIAYAQDPNNNVTEIQVTGHSLGGSMVQEFLKNNPQSANKETPPILGYTFGSPGSQKTKVMSFLTLVGHMALTVIDAAETVVSVGTINKIDKMRRHINQIKNTSLFNLKSTYQKDSRLVEYYHTTDPIPALGALGYKHNGESIKLYDRMNADDVKVQLKNKTKQSKISKFFNLVADNIPVVNSLKEFAITYHGIRRYVINLKDIIEDSYSKHSNLSTQFDAVTQYTQEFKKADKQFIETLEQNKDEVAYAIKSSFYTKEQLSNQYNDAKTKEEKQKIVKEILKQGFDLDEVIADLKNPNYSNQMNADVVISKLANLCQFDTFASFVLDQQKNVKSRGKTQVTPLCDVVGEMVKVSNPAIFGINFTLSGKKTYGPLVSTISRNINTERPFILSSTSAHIQPLKIDDSSISDNFTINNSKSIPFTYDIKTIKNMDIKPAILSGATFELAKPIDLPFNSNSDRALTIAETLNKEGKPLEINPIRQDKAISLPLSTAIESTNLAPQTTTSSSVNVVADAQAQVSYHVPTIAEKRRKLGMVQDKVQEVKQKFGV